MNLFEKDFVFVPINESLHWSLVVICRPGKQVSQEKRDVQKEAARRERIREEREAGLRSGRPSVNLDISDSEEEDVGQLPRTKGPRDETGLDSLEQGSSGSRCVGCLQR